MTQITHRYLAFSQQKGSCSFCLKINHGQAWALLLLFAVQAWALLRFAVKPWALLRPPSFRAPRLKNGKYINNTIREKNGEMSKMGKR